MYGLLCSVNSTGPAAPLRQKSQCIARHPIVQHEVTGVLAAQGEEQLELEVFGRGGHASMPPRHGSVRCMMFSQGLQGATLPEHA